ncbi:MAG: transposase [Leptolyngbya sp. BL-A-14]
MPPRAKLQPHLSTSELKTHYQQARDAVEARRWHLLYLVNQQQTIKQAAQIVGVNYDYAKEIIRRYNQQGTTGIKNRSQRGQPSPRSLLTPAQQVELRQTLQNPPPDGGRWTGPKVAHWIAAKTGKQIWAQRGWEYLQRLSR